MTFIKKLILSSVFLAILTINGITLANTGQMDTTLARIAAILNQINPLINLAEEQQSPHVRVRFQFNALRHDIARIQEGIGEAINRVTIQPRTVSTLSGDYLSTAKSALEEEKERSSEDKS